MDKLAAVIKAGPTPAAAEEASTVVLDARTQQQATLLPLVQAVTTEFETAFDLSSAVTPENKQTLLEFGTRSLLDGVCTPAGVSGWLRLLKILARTRQKLERTLYAPDFILFLLRTIDIQAREAIAAASAAPDAAASSSSTPSPILSDCVRLLLNMCIVNRTLVHEAILSKEKNENAQIEEEKATDPTAESGSAPTPTPLHSLVSLLPVLRNPPGDRELRFFFVRLLLFVLVEPRLAKKAIAQDELYQNLIQTILKASEGTRLGQDISSGSSAAAVAPAGAGAASAASPTTGGASDDVQYSDARENRRVVGEALKLLSNLSLQDDKGVPTLRSVVEEADPELYRSFLRRVASILGSGVGEVPEECREGFKGDDHIARAVKTAQEAAAAATAASNAAAAVEAAAVLAAEAAAETDPASSLAAPTTSKTATTTATVVDADDAKRPVTPDEISMHEALNAAPEAGAAGAGASAAAAAPAAVGAGNNGPALPSAAVAAAAALATFEPDQSQLQRQQTRVILALMAREAQEDDPAHPPGCMPNSASLLRLQSDLAPLLLGADLKPLLPFIEGRDESDDEAKEAECKPFHALMQILHRHLVWMGSNTSRRRGGEELLSPILSVLSKVVGASPVCRAHAKRCIFLDLAAIPALGPDGKPFKKSDASNYAMTPAGALSDKQVDADPLALKTLLLSWIITLNFNLKQNVSEFLYKVCNEDTSEYIRLLGFGNAVGLLAEKGLPGFNQLGRAQAINMDDVIKSGKKL